MAVVTAMSFTGERGKVSSNSAGNAPLQDLLFDGDFAPLPSDMGFRGTVAHKVAGITYRQLDYWARTGLVVPEIREAGGSGTQLSLIHI